MLHGLLSYVTSLKNLHYLLGSIRNIIKHQPGFSLLVLIAIQSIHNFIIMAPLIHDY
jgi:hypothetical protein